MNLHAREIRSRTDERDATPATLHVPIELEPRFACDDLVPA